MGRNGRPAAEGTSPVSGTEAEPGASARKLLPGRVSGGRRRDGQAEPGLPVPCGSTSLPAVSRGPSLSRVCVSGLGPALPGHRSHVWPPGGGVPCMGVLLGAGGRGGGWGRRVPLSGLPSSPQPRWLSDPRAKDSTAQSPPSVPSKAAWPWCPAATGVGCSCPQSKGGSRLPTPRGAWGLGQWSETPQRPAGDVKGPSGRVGTGQNRPHLRVCGRGVGPGACVSQPRGLVCSNLGGSHVAAQGAHVSQPRGPAGLSLLRGAGKSGSFVDPGHSYEHVNSLHGRAGAGGFGFPGRGGEQGCLWGLAPLATASPPFPPSAPSPKTPSKAGGASEAPSVSPLGSGGARRPRVTGTRHWPTARSDQSTSTFISLKSHRVTGEPGGPGTKPSTPAVCAGGRGTQPHSRTHL